MSNPADKANDLQAMAAQLHDLTDGKEIYAVGCQYIHGQDRLLSDFHL